MQHSALCLKQLCQQQKQDEEQEFAISAPVLAAWISVIIDLTNI